MWTRTGHTHTHNRQPSENGGSWWWWRWYERILGLMLKHHISFLYPRRMILILSLRMPSSLPIALLWLTTFDCNHFAACEFCWWIHTLTHPQSEAVVVFVFVYSFCDFQLISLTWNESSENTRMKKKSFDNYFKCFESNFVRFSFSSQLCSTLTSNWDAVKSCGVVRMVCVSDACRRNIHTQSWDTAIDCMKKMARCAARNY